MKKIFIILSIVIVVMVGVYKLKTIKSNVEPVVSQDKVFFDLDGYSIFYLNLDEVNITTKTISKYINNDMTIVSINPYVNPIYKDYLGDMSFKFNSESLKKNITRLKNDYVSKIKESGYLEDYSNFDINGIKISEIEVYAKGSDIVLLFYKLPYIKYKNYLNESYNYFDF